jgi:hypothetical protein
VFIAPSLERILKVTNARRIGIAAAFIAVVTIWLLRQPEPQVTPPPVVALKPNEIRPESPNAIASHPPVPTAGVAKQQDATISLAAKLKELAASPEPRDAFTAFHILRQCKYARDEERRYQMTPHAERDPDRATLINAGVVGAKFIEQSCGDLKEADFRDRIALLERAAEAGVPMAALRFGAEGPWGDEQALYTRWDDPLVQEWRIKVIRLTHLAASKGDVSALSSLQAQYEDGAGLIAEKNSELALQYAVAKHIVHEAQTGRKIVGAKWELEQMTAAVAPEVAARARSAGEKLAKEALGGKVK